MGAITQQPIKLTLTHYSNELHSVEGSVSVYRLKGQQLFLFQKTNTPLLFTKVAERISAIKCQNLCTYYGNLFNNTHVQTYDECTCIEKDIQTSSFWSFQNHSIFSEIQLNIQELKYPTQKKLWNTIGSLCEAANILMSNGLYVDFTLDNVHISPIKVIQMYWGNAKIGNTHRQFYHYKLRQNQINACSFSPEELRSLKLGKIGTKLDLQKCVMHSLGMLILMYSSNVTSYSQIYDFQRMEIKKLKINKLLAQLQRLYSKSFVRTILLMIAQQPSRRISFKSLLEIQQRENNQFLNMDQKHKLMQNDTCASSKVSIKYYQH